MHKYTIYCTKEQTTKAFELGAPIKKTYPYTNVNAIWAEGYIELNHGYVDSSDRTTFTLLKVPTAEQMIGWLEDYGFNFAICKCSDGTFCNFFQKGAMKYYYTRKEATFAAIDAALDCISKNK